MPLNIPAGLWQFSILLLLIPAQLFFSNISKQGDASQSLLHSFGQLYSHIAEFIDDVQIITKPSSRAAELRTPTGYMIDEKTIRSPKSWHIKFSIGDVVQDSKHKYNMVIIGWDEYCIMDEKDLKEMDTVQYIDDPFYYVIADIRKVTIPGVRLYLPQSMLSKVSDTRVSHPDITDYFEGYQNSRYVPRPLLKKLYPHDCC